MKSTGITRKIDQLGRLVIPTEMRKTYGIGIGDPVEIFTEGENIILRKYQPGCLFCGSLENLLEHDDKHVCISCVDKVYVRVKGFQELRKRMSADQH